MRFPECMVALPLARSTNFSIFLVLVPENEKFDWHSHPRMVGLSKCLFGELEVTVLNKKRLTQTKKHHFSYPKTDIRQVILNPNGVSTAAVDS
jgi:hypothetical protein